MGLESVEEVVTLLLKERNIMEFKISDREWQVLFDEPSHLFKMYAAIRKYMDYQTGMSGIKRRFSEQFFSGVLYVEPKPGRPRALSGYPTKKEIYYSIQSLAKIKSDDGTPLIILRKDLGPFVFELPLASTGHSQWGTNRELKGNSTGNQWGTENNSKNNEKEADSAPNREHQKSQYSPQKGTLLESGNNNINLFNGRARVANNWPRFQAQEKYPPPDELIPDGKTKMHALNKYFPEDQIPALAESLLDWHRANGVWRTDYQAELRQWITRRAVETKENPVNHGDQPGKCGSTSGGYFEQNRRFSQRKLSAAERQLELQREFERLHPDEGADIIDITGQCARVN
ncbi:hypothetical protein E3U44_10775 [Nitrosococcus wardiae]|uniref:DnaT DNA-binding domain-containing protein n=1 Tax=Nitrosococcus wardiae TaxID=1814290 RepID=A0A4P7C279_9GAMM|nr:hypothetical protein E3U44_10775 [Nitrosococcus wardiae]